MMDLIAIYIEQSPYERELEEAAAGGRWNPPSISWSDMADMYVWKKEEKEEEIPQHPHLSNGSDTAGEDTGEIDLIALYNSQLIQRGESEPAHQQGAIAAPVNIDIASEVDREYMLDVARQLDREILDMLMGMQESVDD